MNIQSDDHDLICEFVSESRDMLDEAEQKMLGLDKLNLDGRIDIEAINAVFRQFHSIKGSAGFFQLKNISSITHEAETLLDSFRKGKAACQLEHLNLLCAACDMLRKLLDAVEQNMTDEDASLDEVASITEKLAAAVNGATVGGETADFPADAVPLSDNTPPPERITVEPEPVQADPSQATPDMVKLFIQDAGDLLDDAEQALLALSKQPENADDLVNEVFRVMHTFKGNSGFLGFSDLQKLSHKTETILNLVRDKTVPLNETNLQILLNITDILKNAIERLMKEGSADVQGCEVMLQVLAEMDPEGLADAESTPATPSSPATKPSAMEPPAAVPPAAVPPAAKPSVPQPAVAETPAAKKPAPAVAAPDSKKSAVTAPVKVVRQNIRVDVDKLDLLNNLIGELVIAESMVTNNSDLEGLRIDNFDRSAHHLRTITAALQDIAMSLRMVPLSATLRKMIRLVHDLAGKSGKKIELNLMGEETEVDKTVVELIADPLVHLVRNAADHGVETPEDRLAAGKSETGTITLEARHQSGEVWIIIADDGRGLNRDKILAKGIERGLVRGGGENLSDEDIYALILEPGFSTADAVTDISGRGVGMDVVKRNLDKLRGRIVITTIPGKSTTFTLRIPLTLAIIQGMLLRVARERYVLPMLTIRESFRPTADMVHTVTGRGEMVSIRGELAPLFRLDRLLRIDDAAQDASRAIVVVVEDGNTRVALLVDELLGQQEVVIKSLGDVLGQVKGVSGACILPDGQVGLILDVRGIIHMATGRDAQFD